MRNKDHNQVYLLDIGAHVLLLSNVAHESCAWTGTVDWHLMQYRALILCTIEEPLLLDNI